MKTTITGALRNTLKEAMAEDEDIILLGQDIGEYGGAFNVTRGLIDEFGKDRVIDTPLSEIAIAGAGIGAALMGLKPVIEIMYADFLPIVMDQIINNAAKMNYLSYGEFNVPLVIRSNFGAGGGQGAQHSQTPHSWFMNVPGLKIVIPSTPKDARDLLKLSIKDNNPVLFLEHKQLYRLKGEIEEEEEPIPLGVASIKKKGEDITVVAESLVLHKVLKASKELEKENIWVEVIDVRTIKPLDQKSINKSVRKTGRLLIVEENPYFGGWGAQVIQETIKNEFEFLKTSPERLTRPDIPLPSNKKLEEEMIPNIIKIKEIIKKMINN